MLLLLRSVCRRRADSYRVIQEYLFDNLPEREVRHLERRVPGAVVHLVELRRDADEQAVERVRDGRVRLEVGFGVGDAAVAEVLDFGTWHFAQPGFSAKSARPAANIGAIRERLLAAQG